MILVFVGLLESYFHEKSLSNLPIRIHVNGARGKSSVTRLIAAGLREGGIVTMDMTAALKGGEIVIDTNSVGPAKNMLLAINEASGYQGVMDAIS